MYDKSKYGTIILRLNEVHKMRIKTGRRYKKMMDLNYGNKLVLDSAHLIGARRIQEFLIERRERRIMLAKLRIECAERERTASQLMTTSEQQKKEELEKKEKEKKEKKVRDKSPKPRKESRKVATELEESPERVQRRLSINTDDEDVTIDQEQ